MFPTLYSSDMVSIHSWGLMVLMAFAVGCGVAGWRAPKVGIDPDKLVPLYVLVGVAGMLGARLLHFVFAEPALFFGNPLVFFDVNHGGWAFYGGVIGGVGSGALYARLRGVPVWKFADIAAPSIMLGLAIGRVGCFLAGCCHGGVCDAPVVGELLALPYGEIKLVEGFPFLALRFEPGVGVGSLRGSILYPTQLMEIGSGLLWFGLLSAMWRWGRRFDGQVLAAMMVLYAGSRTWVEGFRGDSIRGLYEIGGVELSTSRLVAIGMGLGALAIVAIQARRGVAPEVPFAPEDDDDDVELGTGGAAAEPRARASGAGVGTIGAGVARAVVVGLLIIERDGALVLEILVRALVGRGELVAVLGLSVTITHIGHVVVAGLIALIEAGREQEKRGERGGGADRGHGHLLGGAP